MRLGAFLLATTLLVVAPSWSQQSTPPQRTINSRTDSTASTDTKPAPSGTPSNSTAALEQYRQAWMKMTPAQQKALVSAGGLTPEQYEKMLAGKSTPAKGTNPSSDARTADPGALDALSRSLQDLNAVRDGNLSLVQKDGCAPELASRIADLKARLRADEFELNGTEAPANAAPTARTQDNAGAADAMAVASDWFKRSADTKAAATSSNASRTRESSLLDAVLTGTPAAPAPERHIDPKSPEAEQKRLQVEADMARVKAELDQLSGACASAKK